MIVNISMSFFSGKDSMVYLCTCMSGEAYEALQDKDANTLYLIYEEE